MKTIVQVVQHLSPGGLEVMALELKKANQNNMKMLIVSLEGNKTEALKKWPRLASLHEDVIFMNKKSGWDLSLFFQLASLFRKVKADAVHTHHIGPLLYGGIAARVAGVKKRIHTEHDAWHLDNNKRCLLEKICLRIANPLLVADAKIVADRMRYKLKRNNIKIIRNGIDVDHFCFGNKKEARLMMGLPQGIKLVGTVGRLETVKGQEYLIRALQYLDQDTYVAIAGDGSRRQALETISEAFHVKDRIIFLGNVENMPSFYQALDVFCLPSLQEGLPLSLLEAQACGVPSIVSDVGGTSEALCQHSGLLVPPADVNALSSGIKQLLLLPPSVNPREFVEKNGDLKAMAQAYAELSVGKGEAA